MIVTAPNRGGHLTRRSDCMAGSLWVLLRRRVVPFLEALTVAALLCARADAREFYVDCSRGVDSANGRSPHSAWEHLAAVNAFASGTGFLPGDKILLKRGCRWREELRLPGGHATGEPRNSGSDRQPLVISSYGTGDLPTIDAADPVSHWKYEKPGVYSSPVRGAVYKVFADGDTRETEALAPQPNFLGPWQPDTEYRMWDYVLAWGMTVGAMRDAAAAQHFTPAPWFHAGDLAADQRTSGLANVTRVSGSWYLDPRSGLLYVHLSDGSDPSGHSMAATRRCYGMELEGVSHINVDGLRIIHAAKSGILATVSGPNHDRTATGNEFNTIQNSVFWNEGDVGTDLMPGSSVQAEGAIVVAPSADPSGAALRGWVIQNNAFGLIDGALVSFFPRSAVSILGTDGLLLKNNYIASQYAFGASIYTDHGPRCVNPRIEGNEFAANQSNLHISGCTNPLIDSNTIAYSYGYGIQTGGNTSGAVVTHNLIHNLTITLKAHAFNGLDCNGGAPGGTLAFNTIESVWAADVTLEIGCDHWTVHDNVIDSSNNAQHGGLTLYIRKEALPGMSFQHDIYRVDPNVKRQFNVGAGIPGARTFHDFAWWKANQEPTAILSTEPLFVDAAAGNYRLRRGSDLGSRPQAALPVHPFRPTSSSTVYLSESLKKAWVPQDAFH